VLYVFVAREFVHPGNDRIVFAEALITEFDEGQFVAPIGRSSVRLERFSRGIRMIRPVGGARRQYVGNASATIWMFKPKIRSYRAVGKASFCSKIVPAIRQRFGNKVRIIVRADSGFARDVIMVWCEDNAVF
jgi:hypothetical protein